MRVICSIAAAGLLAGLVCAPFASAAPYDGAWIADIPAQSGCNYTGTMTMLVNGHDLSGQVHNGITTQGVFTGQVGDDGNAVFRVNGRYVGTMSFNGDHFEATWNNGNCDRHAEGDRAPTGNEEAIQAAQRRQHQDLYADLVRRAEAGDASVDYAALRSEAVYAKDWDFYDIRVNGLVDQAAASVKGGDCAAAMTKLDEVEALDFTVDSVHALKADCLNEAGDHDRAAIEAAIARGLIHSLMDSGNGHTEHTAYVVSSLREEMDVLANRHIQMKTRETELRGSNGRYYDLVHTVEIGAFGVDQRDIYFDISSFMAGRASHRAAVEAANATVR